MQMMYGYESTSDRKCMKKYEESEVAEKNINYERKIVFVCECGPTKVRLLRVEYDKSL